jgi:xylan 1,4-beta-xylosidase
VRALKAFFAFSLACALLCPARAQQAQTAQPQTVLIDASEPATPFPHFWEQMFGSGRAILSLRESYRTDLRAVKKITGFQYVRFHGIFLDEVGVYSENKQGKPEYDFTYVDQIYDGLLKNGVKPFVEISFMPEDMASALDYQGFWYKPIVSPPRDYAQWDDLIRHFTQHLVDRYGIGEVSKWYFEVWNEPNLVFGRAVRHKKPTLSSTTTPPSTSKVSVRA